MNPVVIDGPRMSDISQEAESLWLQQFVRACGQANRRILGVHLWTHSPCKLLGNPILVPLLARLKEAGTATALQVTVTGLGGTAAEPGIEGTDEAFEALERLIRTGYLSEDRISLRIDPLQAWQSAAGGLSNCGAIPDLLARAQRIGIRRIRVSLISCQRYRKRIDPRALQRGLEQKCLSLPEIGRAIRSGIEQGLEIRTCASDLSGEGVPPGSCFDFSWVTGLPPSSPGRAVASRKGCLCFLPKSVSLCKIPRRSSCSGRCVACYAQDHL